MQCTCRVNRKWQQSSKNQNVYLTLCTEAKTLCASAYMDLYNSHSKHDILDWSVKTNIRGGKLRSEM